MVVTCIGSLCASPYSCCQLTHIYIVMMGPFLGPTGFHITIFQMNVTGRADLQMKNGHAKILIWYTLIQTDPLKRSNTARLAYRANHVVYLQAFVLFFKENVFST